MDQWIPRHLFRLEAKCEGLGDISWSDTLSRLYSTPVYCNRFPIKQEIEHGETSAVDDTWPHHQTPKPIGKHLCSRLILIAVGLILLALGVLLT